jgi:hypothetical protein
MPGFASIVGALDELAEPSAGLRCINTIGIGRRSLEMIELKTREVRSAHIPFITFSIGRQDKGSFVRPHQHSYFAHYFLLLNFAVRSCFLET